MKQYEYKYVQLNLTGIDAGLTANPIGDSLVKEGYRLYFSTYLEDDWVLQAFEREIVLDNRAESNERRLEPEL